MTENEQIEEMAKVLCLACHTCDCEIKQTGGICDSAVEDAEAMYKAGYRKASEVAKEIFEELEASFGILSFPVVTAVGTVVTERAEGLHISSEDYEAIKKRYTEEK